MSNVYNRDCFICEYDDCIFDEITADDIKESKERDGDIKYYFMDKRQKKNREYRAVNKDRIAAYQREYRAANKDRIAAHQREYRAANKDRIAAYQREYRAANKDRIAACKREYRATQAK